MKKWITTIGATASIVTPAVTLVSCQNNNETPKQDETNKEGTTPLTEQAPTTQTNGGNPTVVAPLAQPTANPAGNSTQQPVVNTPAAQPANTPADPAATQPTSQQPANPAANSAQQPVVNAPATAQQPAALTTWDVTEDGIYFKKSTYSGKIFSKVDVVGQGVESTAKDDELIAMPTDGSYMSMTNVTEIGDNDTFYMVFDKDDSDGLTFDKFTDEFFFMDTSYSSGNDVDGFNNSLGSEVVDTKMGWKQLLISFKDGHNQPWAGSQSNHSSKTFDEAMADLKTQVSDSIYKDIETYYQSHSRAFVPLYQPAGLFTYKQVADNAYAITYNHKGTNLTAFAARVKPTNGGTSLKFDTFSVGTDKEWSAYHNHPEATYFAKKN